jgi:hypothetical protein
MIQRCTNPRSPDYPRYGGRGIKVCKRWMSVKNCFDDMGPRPDPKRYTLHRIDNDKDYELDNCKWATTREQMNNRRGTKLNQDKANQMREVYKIGFTRRQLAYLFNVRPVSISDITLLKTWSDP